MPYVVTTTTPYGMPQSVAKDAWTPDAITRVAVATLFEAREEAAHRIEQITGGDPDLEEVYTDAQGCSELGDTFGPLPDGSVVEVERVRWDDLREAAFAADCGTIERYPGDDGRPVIDAFNAAQ